jgi:hypothetical protein
MYAHIHKIRQTHTHTWRESQPGIIILGYEKLSLRKWPLINVERSHRVLEEMKSYT